MNVTSFFLGGGEGRQNILCPLLHIFRRVKTPTLLPLERGRLKLEGLNHLRPKSTISGFCFLKMISLQPDLRICGRCTYVLSRHFLLFTMPLDGCPRELERVLVDEKCPQPCRKILFKMWVRCGCPQICGNSRNTPKSGPGGGKKLRFLTEIATVYL